MKPSIVVDIAYIAPKGRGRKAGHRHLRGKLKYLQYRDSRDTHLRQAGLPERWRDHGLGTGYRAIQTACSALASKHVLAWTWVVSPAPDLMALVPEDQRRKVVMDVTERLVESYYEARGVDLPEYAFVLHDRTTRATEGQHAMQHLHTHVILPGTVPTLEARQPFYNNTDKGHDRLFREIAARHFEAALDQAVGPRWRALRPERQPALPASDDLSAWFPREG